MQILCGEAEGKQPDEETEHGVAHLRKFRPTQVAVRKSGATAARIQIDDRVENKKTVTDVYHG